MFLIATITNVNQQQIAVRTYQQERARKACPV